MDGLRAGFFGYGNDFFAEQIAVAAGRRANAHRVFGCVDGLVPAGNGVHLRIQRQLLRGDLVAHRGDRSVFRADEDDAFFFATFGELGVLRQEAIAWMHGLRAGLLAGLDDAVGQQIALAAGRGADVHRLVGQLHMARVAVGVGIHRHRRDAHLLRGLDDAAGDLAAVGDQDLVEHLGLRPLHSGMLPCLRHGLSSFLSRSMASERHKRLRVSCGWMTSST